MAFDTVTVSPKLGDKSVKLIVPKESPLAIHVEKTSKFAEFDFLEYIRGLNLTGTYVDVGAYVGNHTVFFSDFCSSEEVIAIEPKDVYFNILVENTKKRPKVKAVKSAICEEAHHDCPHSKVRVQSKVDFKTSFTRHKYHCHCVSIDGVCAGKDISFLKVDVEDDPSRVIAGAKETLRRCGPVLAVDCSKTCVCDTADTIAKRMYFEVDRRSENTVSVCVPARFKVVFPMFNRVDLTMDLLRDLAREVTDAELRGAHVDVFVYDDASTEDVSHVVDFLQLHGWGYYRFEKNHGKKGFWEVITKIFDDCKYIPETDAFVLMANDDRLCTKFFERLLTAWNSIADRGKGALNFQAEEKRDLGAQWTEFPPERHNKLTWKTQWSDGMLFCSMKTLKTVGYKIPKPDDSRWRKPGISSGVWQWFSVFLNSKKVGLYRVHESLVVHVMAKSSMHGDLRSKEPLRCARFIDGIGSYTRLFATEPIYASLASIPERVGNLEKVVGSLLPQVDVLRVYLNGYKRVPGFLNHERIVVARSQDTGDLGDIGKFFWCDDARGYQLTCDDDLVYAENYVNIFIEAIERFRRQAVVGLHGVILDEHPRKSYYDCRKVDHWSVNFGSDKEVHILGTGTVGYHASALKLKRSDFQRPNMADIWLGLVCQVQGVPMVRIARSKKLMTLLGCKWTIYTDQHGHDEYQTEAANRIPDWKINRVKS